LLDSIELDTYTLPIHQGFENFVMIFQVYVPLNGSLPFQILVPGFEPSF